MLKLSLKKTNKHKTLLHFLDEGHAEITLGPEDRYPLRSIQKAARQCHRLDIQELTLSGPWTLNEQWAFYQGFSSIKSQHRLHFSSLTPKEDQQLHHRIQVTEWLKHYVNMPPSQCTPLVFTQAAEKFLKDISKNYKIKSECIIGEGLREAGYVGCYNVGRGSQNPPVLLSLKIYPKDKPKAPFKATLVGKGITFDSGGYSLKPAASGIAYMKCDMAGAATLTAAAGLAMLEGLNEPIELILCCAENLVSGSAYKPGDILEYKNGVSVEILNTDAEGRLVLADGLIKAQESKAPVIIDAATLTAAAQTAVGKDYAALFTMDAALRNKILDYAEESNENLWPLPLELWHQDMLPSFIADTANAGVSAAPGGASTAAGFLSRFLKNPEQGWIHLDLASAYIPDPNNLWSGGATGNMILSLSKMLLQ